SLLRSLTWRCRRPVAFSTIGNSSGCCRSHLQPAETILADVLRAVQVRRGRQAASRSQRVADEYFLLQWIHGAFLDCIPALSPANDSGLLFWWHTVPATCRRAELADP